MIWIVALAMLAGGLGAAWWELKLRRHRRADIRVQLLPVIGAGVGRAVLSVSNAGGADAERFKVWGVAPSDAGRKVHLNSRPAEQFTLRGNGRAYPIRLSCQLPAEPRARGRVPKVCPLSDLAGMGLIVSWDDQKGTHRETVPVTLP